MANPDVYYLATGARWAVGITLLAAGVTKLRSPKGFAQDLDSHNIIPNKLIQPVSVVLPPVEALLGLALLLGLATRLAATASTALFVVFAAVVTINLVRDNRVPCSCFGSSASSSIGITTVFRNLGLLAISIFAMLFTNQYLALSSLRHGVVPQVPPAVAGIPLAFLTVGAVAAYMVVENVNKLGKV